MTSTATHSTTCGTGPPKSWNARHRGFAQQISLSGGLREGSARHDSLRKISLSFLATVKTLKTTRPSCGRPAPCWWRRVRGGCGGEDAVVRAASWQKRVDDRPQPVVHQRIGPLPAFLHVRRAAKPMRMCKPIDVDNQYTSLPAAIGCVRCEGNQVDRLRTCIYAQSGSSSHRSFLAR